MKAATSTVCLAAALGAASAFAPSSAFSGSKVVAPIRASASQLSMEFAGGLIGADGPEPNSKNFDPFKLSEKTPEKVRYYREAEIKHGRIAMLGMVGLIVPEFFRVPGDIYQGVSVLNAHDAMVEKGPMLQLLFWLSLAEIITAKVVIDQPEDREPGDFALDPLGFCKDPEKAKRMKLSELKNGRLAMMAFSGAVTQMAMTGHGFPFLY